jgi:2-dehydro-3-deoxyglucarate aldolase
MITFDVKTKFRQRQSLFGAWTSLGHPSVTEIFCRGGFDFLGIDLEHSTISLEQSQTIIATSQAAGIPCLPRVSSHNGEQIRRILDSGADGIIVPQVNTHKELLQIVDWCKYPPVGKRGFGVARAQGYGFDFPDYTAAWNRHGTLIIQIESIQAVDIIDELLAHEEVDGVMTGPYDMSGSLGVPGQLDHPKVTAACARVVEACRKSGKSCGTQIVDPTEAAISQTKAQGFTFAVLSSDVFLLWKWSERMNGLMKASRAVPEA